MSDQLSKVVAEMRTTPNAFGWSNRTVLQWADRIESAAAAPVEVELPEPAFHGQGSDCDHLDYYTADQMREYAATLARQLASVTESRDMAKGIIDALAAEMKAAGVELIDYKVVNTRADGLARQLAEANSEMVNLRAANIAYASEVANLYGRAGLAESQLAEATTKYTELEAMYVQQGLNMAEATRRLGEVEGLVGKWRQRSKIEASAAPEFDDPDEMAWHEGKAAQLDESADELEAALTKEPTK